MNVTSYTGSIYSLGITESYFFLCCRHLQFADVGRKILNSPKSNLLFEACWIIFWQAYCTFLGGFAKLRKATISFVMSVCPSIGPHGTTRLLLDGFSWSVIYKYFFENMSRKLQFNKNLVRIMASLHKDLFTFKTKSHWFIIRMRNVSDRRCRENLNIFMFNNFFFSEIG